MPDRKMLALFSLLLLWSAAGGCSPHIHLFGKYEIRAGGTVTQTMPASASRPFDGMTTEEIVQEYLP